MIGWNLAEKRWKVLEYGRDSLESIGIEAYRLEMAQYQIDTETKPEDIKGQVEAAVRAGTGRREIVDKFVQTGVSQASIYGWIAREKERLRAIELMALATQPPPPPPPSVDIAVSQAPSRPINYLDRLQANLSWLDSMMTIAVRNGTVRNPRLALDVIKEIGAHLSRAARINAEIQDVEAQGRFLRALADVIHEEEPAVRDRIVAKMRAIGADGGVL